MKMSAYVVRFDGGFAPNPFGRYCTLACCKPAIRRNAERDDIVVGTASARLPHPGRLIFAVRVKEVIPYQEYWLDPRFADRKPSLSTPISRCGDNIWYQDSDGRWHVAPNGVHDESSLEHDVSAKNALVATEFFYFGRSAIPVDPRFSEVMATTQGHKNCYDRGKIEAFWSWLCYSGRKPGRIDDPTEFIDAGCRVLRTEEEDDDIEET